MDKIENVHIVITNPKNVMLDLCDLLCWWDGFKTGLSLNKDDEVSLSIPENGIKAVKSINEILKKHI